MFWKHLPLFVVIVYLFTGIAGISAAQLGDNNDTIYVKEGEAFTLNLNEIPDYDCEYLDLESILIIPNVGNFYKFRALKKGKTSIYVAEYNYNLPVVIT